MEPSFLHITANRKSPEVGQDEEDENGERKGREKRSRPVEDGHVQGRGDSARSGGLLLLEQAQELGKNSVLEKLTQP